MSLLFLQHRRFEEESLLMLVDLSVVLELVALTKENKSGLHLFTCIRVIVF